MTRSPNFFPAAKAREGKQLNVLIPRAQYAILEALMKNWTMSRAAVITKLLMLQEYEQKQPKP